MSGSINFKLCSLHYLMLQFSNVVMLKETQSGQHNLDFQYTWLRCHHYQWN